MDRNSPDHQDAPVPLVPSRSDPNPRPPGRTPMTAVWRFLGKGTVRHLLLHETARMAACGRSPSGSGSWLGCGTSEDWRRLLAAPACKTCSQCLLASDAATNLESGGGGNLKIEEVRRPRLPSDFDHRAAELYRDGATLRSIALEFRVTARTAADRLRAAGVERRPGGFGENKRKFERLADPVGILDTAERERRGAALHSEWARKNGRRGAEARWGSRRNPAEKPVSAEGTP